MSMKSIVALCLVSVCLGVDYQDWKENKQDMYVSTRERKMYEGVVEGGLDACLKEADGMEGGMAQFHQTQNVCTIFVKAAGSDNLANSTDFAVYTKSPEAGISSDSITTGGTIATIILCIIFGICLVFLALNCQEEEHSIAAQIDNLEKKEIEVEEAVSEDWEKKSQEAEQQEMDEVQKADEKNNQ
eukprot:TRINITY_DN252_c5_g3_i1.p1 TRINITY_DN252_c5_g3~~TRINITY_DN252_c5_g3_i1.p1  ORF type:complete len:186 (+),score=82.64 TRINITY_DN252_c5_g3_i1:136-693(+)